MVEGRGAVDGVWFIAYGWGSVNGLLFIVDGKAEDSD